MSRFSEPIYELIGWKNRETLSSRCWPGSHGLVKWKVSNVSRSGLDFFHGGSCSELGWMRGEYMGQRSMIVCNHRSWLYQCSLVAGWWFQPLWKIKSLIGHLPYHKGEHQKIFETTTQIVNYDVQIVSILVCLLEPLVELPLQWCKIES